MARACAEQARGGRLADRRLLHVGGDRRASACSLRLRKAGAERRPAASSEQRSPVGYRRARTRSPEPAAAGNPHLDGGRSRHDSDRSQRRHGGRNAGRLLPRLGGQDHQRLCRAGLGLSADPDRSGFDRRHRARPHRGGDRSWFRQLGRLCAHCPGRGLRPAREGVRGGGTSARQGRSRDHGPPPAAQRRRFGARDGFLLHRHRDHRRGRPLLHRHGRPTASTKPGADDQPGQRVHAPEPLAEHHPRLRHRLAGSRIERAGRLSAMFARPPPQGSELSADVALEGKGLRTTLFLREGRVDVVRDVSFQLHDGETLALVGESGCGKTLTALSVIRLLPDPPARITAGSVVLDGTDITGVPESTMRSLRGDTVSMVFQEPLTSLDPVFTIGDQIEEAITAHRKVSRREARDMAVDILKEVQIPSPEQRLGDYPHQLSGGMRQRVMIAMALVLDPKVLIADEPTTALDVTIQAQILELIRAEQERRQLAVLLITHNLAVVSQVADRVAVMYAGEIVEEAPASEIFANPRHPYTQGLLSSIPSAAGERRHLYTIPGRVPDPRALPPACLFAPRCPYAINRCWNEHPGLVATDGHLLRCWNPQPFTALQAVEPGQVDPSVAASE